MYRFSNFIKDSKNRSRANWAEKRILLFKYLAYHSVILPNVSFYGLVNLFNLGSLGSISKLVNFCIISGRSRSVFSDFSLSRCMFKRLASSGMLVGVKRRSW